VAPSQVVIDASFLLKLFLPGEESDRAEGHLESWINNSVDITAPHLIVFEVGSVLRNKVVRGILTNSEAAKLLDALRSLDISIVYTQDLLSVAWDVGATLNTANLYDCFYIGLSTLLGAPLWTADKKLYNSARQKYPGINIV